MKREREERNDTHSYNNIAAVYKLTVQNDKVTIDAIKQFDYPAIAE